MTKFGQIFILITSLFLTKYSFGQITPLGLRSEELQKEIILNTSHFDSLILFDRSSFWADNHTVKGFVFRKSACYKVTVTFRKTSEFVLEFGKIEVDEERAFDVLEKYVVSNFNSLKKLDNDSLNIKSRTTTSIDISDATEYSILIVFPKQQTCFYKNSYAPEFYQNKAQTSDRQILLDTFARLKAHIN